MTIGNQISGSQKSSKSRRKCNCKSGKNLPVEPENISELARIEIIVPADVDVDLLLHRYDPDLSRTKKDNLTDRIHYFLSLTLTTNDNYWLLTDGYHRICSSTITDIIGDKDYYLIRDILTDDKDPIIESNNEYHAGTGIKDQGYCKGYRLTSKYNSGNTRRVIFSEKFSKKIRKYTHNDEDLEISRSYEFLTKQFLPENNIITVDDCVLDQIYLAGHTLLKRVDDYNPYQTSMIYNHIGRWIYYINKINECDPWTTVSGKNHRLNSNITNLPKELRPFLRVNGKPLGEIDISSSQPYILSSIMNLNFFNNTNEGYNLYTIYPELYDILVKQGYIKTNVSYTSGNTINYVSSISGTSSIKEEVFQRTSPPFMLCKFSSSEIEDIHKYQSAPFENDFYMEVLKKYTQTTGEVIEDDNPRQKLKKTMMFVLFDDNYNHRNNNQYIQMFGAVYPGVNKWIEKIHRIIGRSQFAYLLQRCESYLMLNVVAREFHDKNPEAPIFSIHDALLTYPEYIPEIAGMTQNRFKEIIDTGVGVKDKTSTRDPRLTLVEIDEVWNEIEPIKTEKKFEKVAGSVLKSNIDAGIRFLHSPVQPR